MRARRRVMSAADAPAAVCSGLVLLPVLLVPFLLAEVSQCGAAPSRSTHCPPAVDAGCSGMSQAARRPAHRTAAPARRASMRFFFFCGRLGR